MKDRSNDVKVNDELRDIQGGLIGFNKDHQRFVFGTFPDQPSARALVVELATQISNGLEVDRFNQAFSENRRHGGPPDALQSTWVNIAFSQPGLALLAPAGLETFPSDFTEGMAARADRIGDVGESSPDKWTGPFAGRQVPHFMLVIAGDNLADLEARQAAVLAVLSSHGITVTGIEIGEARQNPHGSEHFGFKDGVSQPGIDKLTKPGKGGSIPVGEVLVGWPDATGGVSGTASQAPPPQPSAYNQTPMSPQTHPLPDWADNGSFIVYRKLNQNVAGFRESMATNAPAVGLDAGQLAAKAVGRWPSGAPMEQPKGCPVHGDPSQSDPSLADGSFLEEKHINSFDYSDDVDGMRVPRAAHIRKMNPRADVLSDGDSSDLHRMLRRGITYGPDFVDGEAPYGQTIPSEQDRGLLFVSYQSSISRTFEFLQTVWANREDFQKPGDGKDPMISQDSPSGTFNIPDHGAVDFARWVQTMGGGYFFSPSISALRVLSGA